MVRLSAAEALNFWRSSSQPSYSGMFCCLRCSALCFLCRAAVIMLGSVYAEADLANVSVHRRPVSTSIAVLFDVLFWILGVPF